MRSLDGLAGNHIHSIEISKSGFTIHCVESSIFFCGQFSVLKDGKLTVRSTNDVKSVITLLEFLNEDISECSIVQNGLSILLSTGHSISIAKHPDGYEAITIYNGGDMTTI